MLVCNGIFEYDFDPLQNVELTRNLVYLLRTDDNSIFKKKIEKVEIQLKMKNK